MYFRYSARRTAATTSMGASAPRDDLAASPRATPGRASTSTWPSSTRTPTAADVTITYYRERRAGRADADGAGQRGRRSRSTSPTQGVGPGQEVSAKVETTNGVGIVAERPMYFIYNGTLRGVHTAIGFPR